MSEDLKIVEGLFGKDYKQKILNVYMGDFLDEETKILFDDVCEELGDSSILNSDIIELFSVLPYKISYSLIYSIKNRNSEELFDLLRAKFYNDFIRDVKIESLDNTNGFEKRYLNLRANGIEKNAKKFLEMRLLTREELQCLIAMVEKKANVKLGLAKYDYEFYKGDNQYCKQLIKAHSILTNTEHSKARTKIVDKNKKQYLSKILQEVKKLNNALED